ncbi:hypothetical protein ASPBRDRAFT_560234 [Aspergillus brasiliensis CBS 101740]|uniref:Uncharacterized protein n=1 Tax=Aspergillus brasiliensis (strain CBS 101740 / IMI 381727 / IBT 21946) TaxID=767769 RepID=A0A1L9UMM2_ASPBC|nr:hypothetical protein ASPBRDRAFT_560234 [Aspergillus brasiliensis CBS 101740]
MIASCSQSVSQSVPRSESTSSCGDLIKLVMQCKRSCGIRDVMVMLFGRMHMRSGLVSGCSCIGWGFFWRFLVTNSDYVYVAMYGYLCTFHDKSVTGIVGYT